MTNDELRQHIESLNRNLHELFEQGQKDDELLAKTDEQLAKNAMQIDRNSQHIAQLATVAEMLLDTTREQTRSIERLEHSAVEQGRSIERLERIATAHQVRLDRIDPSAA